MLEPSLNSTTLQQALELTWICPVLQDDAMSSLRRNRCLISKVCHPIGAGGAPLRY